jgi:phage tail sheath gpL-like
MSIDASAVARVVGIDTQFKDLRAGAVQFLPQQIAIIGHGSTAAAGYPLTPFRLAGSALPAAARFGFGSPIHHAARELYPATGGGVGSIPVWVYPLAEDAAGVAAVGSITPSGPATVTATYWVRIAGVLSAPLTVVNGDSVATIADKIVAAIDAVLEMPVDAADGATDVDLAVKWKGASGNDITVEVLDVTGSAPTTGLTFAIVQPTTGATDPDVAPALAMLGSTWITMIVNTLGPSNTAALDSIAAVGEGRWGQLLRRPFVCFTGNPEPVVGTATAGTAARPSDRVNCQLVAPGSVHSPAQIAAAQVREIAKVANDNPPTDYGSRVVRGLIPGADAVQWDYAERDLAVKAGSSTVEPRDGLVRISDVVTHYRPTGEVPPAYRYVVDIMKLMTIIYNADLEFSKPEWNGAPLIPDGQPTANPNARTPSAAKAAWCSIIDSLALEAILSDPQMSKKNTFASVDPQNPKRLNLRTTVKLSGNTNIISTDLFFGFYFGAPTLVG